GDPAWRGRVIDAATITARHSAWRAGAACSSKALCAPTKTLAGMTFGTELRRRRSRISGDRVLNDSACNALARFTRDAIIASHPRVVILLEGSNDIGFSQPESSGRIGQRPGWRRVQPACGTYV
ncbi:MAG: hypothetical protein J2P17_27765, partial [Mycobacterium sp.]|nr:hypothetical protein [Mycobacterium sp.]